MGSRAGASDVKAHAFFRSLNFALLRHMTPPIVPGQSVQHPVRPLHDSVSFDLESDIPVDAQHDSSNPFSKFNSGMCIITCGVYIRHGVSSHTMYYSVTLYHDGDSDSETIVFSDD